MPTIQEHYDLIAAKIQELKQAVVACKQETGYLPEIQIDVKTSLSRKDGNTIQHIDEPFIRFDGFKKLGQVTSTDRHLKKADEIQALKAAKKAKVNK